jgi:hypothetical protein
MLISRAQSCILSATEPPQASGSASGLLSFGRGWNHTRTSPEVDTSVRPGVRNLACTSRDGNISVCPDVWNHTRSSVEANISVLSDVLPQLS